MATFIGENFCKVDAKGRITLPAAFKKQMPSDARDHFIVRKDIFDNCLVLYSLDDWNKQLEKIRKKVNPYNRAHSSFLRNFFKGMAELELDSNSRFLVPRRLLDLIDAGRDVVLAGQEGRIEIWAAENYHKTDISGEELASLAEDILGGNSNEE
ncbi:MAG TPA: cell division/cell wall cluster transcriptional repressor MraZ [Bacteroidales bacterium]|jgi:MraZ protein|nr:cell division/cell wall cluster transcriptional repressor MraZ [Bacteroidales bacterium]HOS72651.1 cell division/cell wall cluster transcriptional repressor MraZ [Bacteroidales bacterium]HQH24070.1 cell division/cell wall cluster transcriptional repressor MraZ [Bacteroidales bacterium]HQJ83024.1 cell division/cell wall cluster transcriptional repressor MraZ [Bacteroidales bacterium]